MLLGLMTSAYAMNLFPEHPLYAEMTERSLHTSSYENWQLVQPNDLVLNRFKAHLGVFFASKYTGIVTFHYGVYEAKMPLVAKYYEALYHTPVYCRVYAGQSRGITKIISLSKEIGEAAEYTEEDIEKLKGQKRDIEEAQTLSFQALQVVADFEKNEIIQMISLVREYTAILEANAASKCFEKE